MAENFIFSMQDLRRVKGGKEILKGIWVEISS
jgi:sulfate-transporting ATPase